MTKEENGICKSLYESLDRFKRSYPELSSATKILSRYPTASNGEETFVREYAGKLEGGSREARKIYRMAFNIQENAALIWANIKDAVSPYYSQTIFNNLPEEFLDYLKSIPEYDRLFGSLDYISCDHCRSIFGPAAYFADLMRFDDTYISLAKGTRDPTTLKYRRPDLYKIRLDCANSNEMIPQIDLVNELLESFIYNEYHSDAYLEARDAIFPQSLPFNRPLEEIRSYLKRYNTSLYQIYNTFAKPFEAHPFSEKDLELAPKDLEPQLKRLINREFLELAPKDLELIASEISSPGDISRFYGDVPLTGIDGLDNVEVFLEQTRLTRAGLNELLFQNLDRHEVNARLSRLFFINSADNGLKPLSISQDESCGYEKLLNLSPKKLDRIYRFLKLSHKLGWSFTDLDWALRSLYEPYAPEKVLKFDGIKDYVACHNYVTCHNAELDLPNLGQFTLEAWVCPNSSRKNVVIDLFADCSPSRDQILLEVDPSNKLSLYIRRQDDSESKFVELFKLESNSSLSLGSFTHIALVVGNGKASIYINGKLDAENALITPFSEIKSSKCIDFKIGRDLFDEYFDGCIKDVRIWKIARDAVAIKEDRFRRFTDKEKDLIGYWPLVCHNTELDLFKLDQFTIEAWVCPDSSRKNVIVGILADLNSSNDRILLEVNSSNKLFFYIERQEESEPKSVESNSSLPLGTFSHIALVVGNDEASIYIDGRLDVKTALKTPFSDVKSGRCIDFNIGRDLFDEYFDGCIKDVRIWKIARDSKAIKEDRYNRFTGNEVDLIGYWPLTEGGDNVITQPKWVCRDLILDPLPIWEEDSLLKFNGVDQYLEARGVDIAETREISIEAWISIDEMKESCIICLSDDYEKPKVALKILNESNDQGLLSLQMNFPSLQPQINWPLLPQDKDRFLIPQRKLTHVCIVLKHEPKASKLEMYINGTLSGEYSLPTQVSMEIKNGEINVGRDLFSHYFHGGIREIRIWNLARNRDEITLNMYRPVPSGDPGLVGYWRLNEVEKEVARDLSCCHNDLYLGGLQADYMPIPVTTEVLPRTFPVSAKETILKFDGDNDVIAIKNSNNWGLGRYERMTLELWFKPESSINSDRKQIIFTQGDKEAGLNIYFHEAYVYVLEWNNNSNGKSPAQSVLKAQLNGNDWHHVVLTHKEFPQEISESDNTQFEEDIRLLFKEPELRGYLDGKPMTSVDDNSNNFVCKGYRLSSVGIAYLGGLGQQGVTRFEDGYSEDGKEYQYFFAGNIANLRIWNSVKEPADQIARDCYLAPQITDDLVTYMPMVKGEDWIENVFSWDKIPGKDNGILRKFLIKKFGIGWVETAKIEKIDNGKTVKVYAEKISLSLELNDEKTEVILEIDDGRKYEFIAKMENDELNIYEKDKEWIAFGWPKESQRNPHSGTLQRREMALVTDNADPQLINIYSHYSDAAALEWNNYSYSGRMRITDINAAVGVTFFSRHPEGIDQCYLLGHLPGPDNKFRLFAHPFDYTSDIETLQPNTGLDTIESTIIPDINIWYCFEITVKDAGSSTEILAKIWPEDSPEPKESLNAIDKSDIRIRKGTVGLWSSGSSKGKRQFDDLKVKDPNSNTILLDKNFEDQSEKSHPVNWSDVEDRIKSIPREGLFKRVSVDGGEIAFGTDSKDSNIHSYYIDKDKGALSWSNYLYQGRMRISDANGSIGVTFLSRQPKEVDQYYALCREGEQGTFKLFAHPKGVQSIKSSGHGKDKTDSGINPLPNTWYRFLIKVQDDESKMMIQAKIWPETSVMPEAFQIDAYDDSRIRIRSGTVGVWASGSGSKYFNDLKVFSKFSISESFERYSEGQDPLNWRDTKANYSNKEDSSLFNIFDVGGRKVLGTESHETRIHSHYIGSDALNWSNYVYTGKMRIGDTGKQNLSGIGVTGGIGVTFLSNYFPDQTKLITYYRLLYDAGDIEKRGFHIAFPQSDKSLKGTVDSKFSPNPNTWYRFKIEVEDAKDKTIIKAKIWPESEAEPLGYQIDAYDDNPNRLKSGTVGVVTLGADSKYFDDLEVTGGTLLSSSYTLEEWVDVGSRVYPKNDALFSIVDLSNNALRWQVDSNYPVLLHPLSQKALEFDGKKKYLAAPKANPDLSKFTPESLSQFTLESWISLSETKEGPIISLSNNLEGEPKTTLKEIGDGIIFGTDSSGCLELWLKSGDQSAKFKGDSNPLPKGQFIHVAVSVKASDATGDRVTFFVDGEGVKAKASDPSTKVPDFSKLKILRGDIGRDGTGQHFPGRIKEVRIWSRALDENEIKFEMYQRPVGSPALLRYWSLGEDDKDIVEDLSPGKNPLWLGTMRLGGVEEDRRPKLQPSKRKPTMLPEIPLDAAALDGIATFKRLKEAYNQPIDRLIALWHSINHVGKDGKTPLFDRIFNPKGSVIEYWNYFMDEPISWDKTGMKDRRRDGQIRSRLMGALRVSNDELNTIVEHISGSDENTIDIDGTYLWRMYQISGLAGMLRLSVTDLLQLLSMIKKDSLGSLHDVAEVCDLAEWASEAGLSVADLAYLTHDPIDLEGVSVSFFTEDNIKSMAVNLAGQSYVTLINNGSFASDQISQAQSSDIFDKLKTLGLITGIGAVTAKYTEKFDLKDLLSIFAEPDKENWILEFDPLKAELEKAKTGLGDEIIQRLISHGFIDKNGIVLDNPKAVNDKPQYGKDNLMVIFDGKTPDATTINKLSRVTEVLQIRKALQDQIIRTVRVALKKSRDDFYKAVRSGILVNNGSFALDQISQAQSSDIFSLLYQPLGLITDIGAVTAKYTENYDLIDLLIIFASPDKENWIKEFDPLKAELEQAKTGLGDEIIQRLISHGFIDENGIVLDRPKVVDDKPQYGKDNLMVIFDGKTPDEITINKLSRVTEVLQIRKALQTEYDPILSAVHAALKKSRDDLYSAIQSELANIFNAQVGIISVIFDYLGVNGEPDISLFIEKMIELTNPNSKLPDTLKDYFSKMSKLVYMAGAFEMADVEMKTLLSDPDRFSISNLTQPTFRDLDNLHLFKRLQSDFGDTEGKLMDLLALKDTAKIENALDDLAGWEPRQIKSLAEHFVISKYNTIQGLRHLKECFDLAGSMQVGVDYLLQIADTSTLGKEDEHTFYSKQSLGLLEILRAGYTDEEWPKVYGPIYGELAEKRRDALLDLALQRLPKYWEEYIFCPDGIPSMGSEELRIFLGRHLKLDWVEGAPVIKDRDIITVTNSFELKNECRNWFKNIPGLDETKLRAYLKSDLGLEWADGASITKEYVVKITNPSQITPRQIIISLDSANGKAILSTNDNHRPRQVKITPKGMATTLSTKDNRTRNLFTKPENGKLNVYDEAGKYLFSWKDIPGIDETKLKEYLKSDLGLDWAEDASITKEDVVKITNPSQITPRQIIISLDSANGKAILSTNDNHRPRQVKITSKGMATTLSTNDNRTRNLFTKPENGKLNVYDEAGKYLFSWKDIPGNSNAELLAFLKNDLGLSWVEGLSPEKTGETLTVKNPESKQVKITLDDTKVLGTLSTDNGLIFDLEWKFKYIFCWNDIPVNSNAELLAFLKNDLGLSWVEGLSPEKTGETLTVKNPESKQVKITLNSADDIVVLSTNDPCNPYTLHLKIKTENGKLNVYDEAGKYLFSWKDIPGNSNAELLAFLKNDLGLSWVEGLSPEKTGETLTVESKQVKITLNSSDGIVVLSNNDPCNPYTLHLKTKTENGKTNVYRTDVYRQNRFKKGADAFQEYFLMDMRVGSEVLTSRIVQGTAALQYYIQRCLMNLEPGVDPSTIPMQEWEWVKNYRVWEANRKVFLYPENYIEPELRDTKSPFFKDLEQELLQTDIRQESVETAYVHYLDKFAEVAKLKIVGSYLHTDLKNYDLSKPDALKKTLYLVGRTTTEPGMFYLREWISDEMGERWLPWEKIDLAINSEFVTPVYAFGKLFLFWSEFTNHKKSVEEDDPESEDPKKKITVTYDVFKASVKYSYYNLSKKWIQPQSYKELDKDDLSDWEHRQLRWQRLSAQHLLNLSSLNNAKENTEEHARVLQIEKDTYLKQYVPLTQKSYPEFEMNEMTWEFWVMSINNGPDGWPAITPHPESPKPTDEDYYKKTSTLADYEDGRFKVEAVHKVTVIPEYALHTGASTDVADKTQAGLDYVNARNYNDAETCYVSLWDNSNLNVAFHDLANVKSLIQTAKDSVISWNETESNPDTTQEQKGTAWKKAVIDADAANSVAVAARDYELAKPKWKSEKVTLSFEVAGHAPVEYEVNYGEWHHVAVTLQFGQGQGYVFELYLQGEKIGGLSQTLEGTSPLTSKGLLTIGVQEDDVESYFAARMSEFRLWGQVRRAEDIQTGRNQRLYGSNGLLACLPLNKDIPDSMKTEPSTLDFSLPIINPLQNRVIDRERLILFYGDKIRSLRNNLKDRSFELKLKNITQENIYDLDLCVDIWGHNASLYLIESPELNIFDFEDKEGYKGYSNGIMFFFEFFNDLILRFIDASRPQLNKGRPILTKLDGKECVFVDVVNQPGWFILDTGDDQFLIKMVISTPNTQEDLRIPTTEEIMREDYEDGSDRVVSLSFDLNGHPLIASSGNNIKIKFERLNTYTVNKLSENLFVGGIDSLLSIESQKTRELDFWEVYGHGDYVSHSLNKISSTIDFRGAMRLYFEEIFFHVPFLIANKLNSNQKFEEAQKWYHYIFNPTASEEGGAQGKDKDRYWRYLPFRDDNFQSLRTLLTDEHALAAYREDPFDPHAIAALRMTAYKKAVVMKYIDNLLDWGDSLFMQDTRESINEALGLYIMAYDLLGPRPKVKTIKRFQDIGTYEDFICDYREDSEFLTAVENLVPCNCNATTLSPHSNIITDFCVPENEKFIGYWDRVEDRLFKIRHSLSFEGIFRQLALFAPPIEPMELVRALAGGASISGALSELNVPVPHYRYSFMLERAKDMATNVMELGSALLAAIESRDAEQLAILQNTHEGVILNLMTSIKENEIYLAKEAIAALEISKKSPEYKIEWYQEKFDENLNGEEIAELMLIGLAQGSKSTAVIAKGISMASFIAPEIIAGGAGISSPVILAQTGGKSAGLVSGAIADVAEFLADILKTSADMTAKMGTYKRRRANWEFEKSLAERELEEIEKQIAVATIQLAIANQELVAHSKTIQQNQEIERFYRSKFSNETLYSWMIGRLSGLYFQAYKLAYDMAKSAEKALQYELPTNETYVTPGHWDSLKKGLLAGESLMLELNRMEKSHLDQDSRFQEIEKTISMNRTFPGSLLLLAASGACEFRLSEELFDRDYPGHYFRVIKSIEIYIKTSNPKPNEYECESVNATLIQLGNKTLLDPDIGAVEYLMGSSSEQPNSNILRVNWRANQQIAISRVDKKDDGMFVLNFFWDDRYFPFEGTGAVSSWRLEIPHSSNPDLMTTLENVPVLDIEDVLIHIRYTAKSERGNFKKEIEKLLE